MYYWKRLDDSSEGSVEILMDVPSFLEIGNELCRVYLNKIRINKKVKSKNSELC